MNTQFWKPIQPVRGEKIPDGAEYKVAQAGCKTWCPSMTGDTFRDVDSVLEWRIPVEVIPIDVAVDALLANAIDAEYNGKRGLFVKLRSEDEREAFVLEVGETTMEKMHEKLKEIIAEELRELAGEYNAD